MLVGHGKYGEAEVILYNDRQLKDMLMCLDVILYVDVRELENPETLTSLDMFWTSWINTANVKRFQNPRSVSISFSVNAAYMKI